MWKLLLSSTAVSATVIFAVIGCGGNPRIDYPAARVVNQTDTYHGVDVRDPYRWLEDLEAEETRQWVEAQNAVTDCYLQALPARASFEEILGATRDDETFGWPQQASGTYVYTHNSGRQERDSIWVTTDLAERGRVLLDPNRMQSGGAASLWFFSLSPDGKKLAYGLSEGGSDWKTWQIRDVETGQDLPEVLAGTKFTVAAWSPDSESFYYSRYPRDENDDFDGQKHVAVYRHKLETEQSVDRLVYSVSDDAPYDPYASVTDDGRYLILGLWRGPRTYGYDFLPLRNAELQGHVTHLIPAGKEFFGFLGNDGPLFFFWTTWNAPLGQIIAVDVTEPARSRWRTIVEDTDAAIESASLVGRRLIVNYLADATSKVKVFDLAGVSLGEVALPGRGTTMWFLGAIDDSECFFSYEDFTTPPTIFKYDVGSGEVTSFFGSEADSDPSDYVTDQVFFTSADGTRVPIFVVHGDTVELDGSLPTILTGYGGFGISLTPRYDPAATAWVEAGGVWAVANIRGGGEYGEAWHQAGTKLQKQNIFDDFIGAAEWLIDNHYTNPQHLAVRGGSNGGLLVGAVVGQRPDLFAASNPMGGILDMLRYQVASANALSWSDEYGLSDNEPEFHALYAYSPYHNLKEGVCYPATLVMADENDNRVVPWHSYKYAARLQNAQGCDRPVLIRIETATGHDVGTTTSQSIKRNAESLAFAAEALEMKPVVLH